MIRQTPQTNQFLINGDESRLHWDHYDDHERQAIVAFEDWSKSFLTRPHEDVGRRGHVCPFVKAGLKAHKSIYLSTYRGKAGDIEAASQEIRQLRDWFLELVPAESKKASFGAVVQLYPRLGKNWDFIMQLHKELKPEFVERKMMFGEFFPSCDGQGIHNPEFRPLQSPVPLFVLRHMHILDLPFLTKCPKQRASYRERFQVASRSDLDKRIKSSQVIKLPLDWDYFANALLSSP